MRYRPTHCPYCGEPVHEMRPYRTPAPPDERESYPPQVTSDHVSGSSEPQSFDEVKCQVMRPCGHVFTDEDLNAVFEGDEPKSTLGERVVNPGAYMTFQDTDDA